MIVLFVETIEINALKVLIVQIYLLAYPFPFKHCLLCISVSFVG